MSKGKILLVALAVAMAAAIGWRVYRTMQKFGAEGRSQRDAGPVPVEVAAVEHGPITDRRTFSGSLEALSEFVVAPKVGGRIEEMTVDLADAVTRGQVIARLDDDEHRQAVAQAEADLAVAEANLAEATSALEIAVRELERVNTLRERGVASESDLDSARADHLAKQAAVQVAKAQVTRAQAALEAARIRLSYTTVTADWPNGDDPRVVSGRYVDEGDTAAANTPLVSIIEINPINAVLHVTEKDYARMTPGQSVALTTDAFPGETFSGSVVRIAPAFQQATRQARVELTVGNDDLRLKPGMFVKATVVMRTTADAVIVPRHALTTRADRPGVFVVSHDGQTAHWRDVTVGIREGNRVQVIGEGLTDRVVTLGQHMLDDGSPVTLPSERNDNHTLPEAAP